MRALFDQGTPVPLRRSLSAPVVATAFEMGWAELSNGKLLDAAEAAGFEAILTTDQNLRHQQNFAGRRIAAVVLPTTSWPRIRGNLASVAAALDGVTPGETRIVAFDV